MERQPTQDEIKKAILDGMVEIMDEDGLDIEFKEASLFEMLPGGVQKGRFSLALQNLREENAIGYISIDNDYTYFLPSDVYQKHIENQDSENEESGKSEESDPWQPIKVEKYEEVAGKIEEFSTAIKSENGLRASHPDETDFVTETADATTKSLREKKGEIIRKRLSALIDGAHRILEICDKTTRIGIMVYAFIEIIKPFL